MRRLRLWTVTMLMPLVLCAAAGASQGYDGPREQYYVVIVANNHSLDDDVASLRYADDDGAKYFEMFHGAGAKTALLTVLDPDAQKRFPGAAAVAVPPRRETLLAKAAEFFSEMARANRAGIKTHFVFVYSGHGNVGPNREGYLNLMDSRFRRSELFHEILAKSPASYNHLILDACHAYYMVNKKGASDKQGNYTNLVRNFLSTEEIRQYPNTGVILAASSESETHEWSQWESGIFSHELRSALLGGGDVNGDGKVTYDEAAACVEAANAGIQISKARLKVFYQPPAMNREQALMNLGSFDTTAVKVVFPGDMAGRYCIEDARGVRVADFHYSSDQTVTLALPGVAPFFIRTDSTESSIESPASQVYASNLTFQPRTAASKGSVESSFRQDLYTIPFGMGFYRGALAMLPELDEPTPVLVQQDGPERSRPGRVSGWIALGSGVAMGAGSAIAYGLANRSYDKYRDAEDMTTADARQAEAENRLLTSRVLLGVGSAFAVTGAVLMIVDAVKHKKGDRPRSAAPVVTVTDRQVTLGLQGRF